MSYTMYTPLNVWLDPASVTDVVAYIQNYLSENTIYSEEEIEDLIHDYLIAHPELIGGVQSVNGKTGTVVLTASDINTTNNTTIQAVINSLSADIASIVQSVTTLSGRITANETGITNEATARANADTALGNRITALQGAVGSPLVASTAAAMTDTSKIYVYTGSETGYTNGNWYYYNGSAWASGGVYNATAINTDTTLTVAGMAADAKATGDGLNDLKSALTPLTGETLSWDDNKTRDLPNVLVQETYSNWASVLTEASEGDVFYVKGSGGNNSRLWVFADSTGASISYSANHLKSTEWIRIVAPSGTSYLACNSRTNDGYPPALIKGTPIELRVSDLENYSDLDIEKSHAIQSAIFGGKSVVYNGSNTATVTDVSELMYQIPFKSKITSLSSTVAVGMTINEKSKTFFPIASNGEKQTVSVFIKLAEENSACYLKLRLSTATSWATSYSNASSGFITVSQSGIYNFEVQTSKISGETETTYTYLLLELGGTKNNNVEYYEVFTKSDFWESYLSNNPHYKADIVCWGDSLTAGVGGDGTTYPNVCASELGLNPLNCGAGGETANTIAARQGGNTVFLPAGSVNGTYPSLTDIYGETIAPLLQGSGAGSGSGIIVNGELCTLSFSDNTYTISGYTGGSVLVPQYCRLVGSDFTGNIVCIWVGQNGSAIGDLSEINARIAIIDSMISHIGHERFVVMGLSSGTESGRSAEDATLLAKYGSKFFPTRKLLVNYGLTINELTPTSQDEIDIAAGTVPTQLRYDAVHLNSYGYTAVGKMLANKIRSLGYV